MIHSNGLNENKTLNDFARGFTDYATLSVRISPNSDSQTQNYISITFPLHRIVYLLYLQISEKVASYGI